MDIKKYISMGRRNGKEIEAAIDFYKKLHELEDNIEYKLIKNKNLIIIYKEGKTNAIR